MARTYDPFRGFDRLMGQVLTTERAAQIPMDLYRSGDHYVLAADIPGADPGSIEVNVEDRTLTIRAKRSTPEHGDVQWLGKERPTGTYARQLTIGRGVDLNDLTATYNDGVLTLTVPVAAEAKPRRVEVQHGAPTTVEAAVSSVDQEDSQVTPA